MSVHVTAPMLAAFNHFLGVGFHENGAGAAVGNFCQESGEFLVTTMYRAHPDFSGGVPDALKSGGIAEWLGDRKTAYLAFAGRAETRLGCAKGSLLNDLGTQCDFVVYELQTDSSYETLYKQLTNGSRSVANLTANFMMVYERPKLGPTANLDNRIAHAEAVVRVARSLRTGQTPQPAPSAPIPQVPAPQAPPPVLPPSTLPAGPPPISASTAGRQSAVMDNLLAMRDGYLAERAAIDAELAVIETTIADFGKLIAPPAPVALQKSIIEPAATMPQRRSTVLGITNWKTTFAGIVAAVAGIAKVVPELQPYSDMLTSIMGIAMGAGLMVAKDGDVTGGTVPATDEAKRRVSH